MDMEDQTDGRPSDLKALAEARFGTLSDAEKLLLENVHTGEWATCGPKREDTDPTNDPKDADKWGEARQIRAGLVAWLCTDGEARNRVHWRGIQIYGANVTGPLDLSFASIPFQLALRHCRIEVINLQRAELSQLDLRGSLVYRIAADGVLVKNAVAFCDGFAAMGEVRLPGAQIGDDLDCVGGSFINPPTPGDARSGSALFADLINVKGSVLLGNGFNARGEVRLAGAQVGGVLQCGAGSFINPPQKGVDGALIVDRINVRGAVFLNKSFTANGEVRFLGAQVGSNFDCSDGTFTNPLREGLRGSGYALSLDRINVKGSVILRGRFNGEVRLLGVQVGRNLDCTGGTFNPRQQDVPGGDTALSQKDIPGSGMGPLQKDAPGSGTALNAERIFVRDEVYLNDAFIADGEVNLYCAQIGGAVDCRSGNFQNATLNLTDASAASLYDSGVNDVPADPVAATMWPEQGNLLLDGFVYGRIASKGRIDVAKRLDWLGRQPSPPFLQRPYLQLAKVLRESGDSDAALQVLEKMEELRRGAEEPGAPKWLDRKTKKRMARLWSLVLKTSIGYGYHPGQAIWFIIVLSVVGCLIYGTSYYAGTMVPTDKDAYKEFKDSGAERRRSPHYSTFSPLVYSVGIHFRWSNWGRLTSGSPPLRPEVCWRLPSRGFSGSRFCSAGCWPPSLLRALAVLCTKSEIRCCLRRRQEQKQILRLRARSG